MTDMENMTTCQKSQGMWPLPSILQPQLFVGLGNLTLIALRLNISIFTVFPRITANPFRLVKVHETNRACSTVALQSNEWIFTLLPVIFPAAPRVGIPLCLPFLLRARFPSLLLSQEEESSLRWLRFWRCRRIGLGIGLDSWSSGAGM
jgi:hypothetical protein